MENEIWKEVPGFEDRYLASNLGKIKSIKRDFIDISGKYQRKKERILSELQGSGLYKQVSLYRNNKGYKCEVHKIIAITFWGYKPNRGVLVVNHINGIPSDNRVSNLEITTVRNNATTCKDVYKKDDKKSGAYFNKRKNIWFSSICINNKSIALGCFKTEIEAHNVYKLAVVNMNLYSGDNAVFRSFLKTKLALCVIQK